ncbi:ATP-dependent DNA helicase PIF1 [Rhincodon typus]|uniref:ATP-dependent DNA helicase PIF1 n=1 Tax=Rhincodon typus TaxID=259920 RepID=UPI0009A3D1B0|nr:ATP-dependent DNA helicase PIF1 [Rhincodon typus]XP_048458140.1 ATP-dependent DNA helicase PIF1 [Rhincodon typus]XP_048458141.1 ATP-dependent DNA helicase PIF1 [Rhincodon typus]
MLSASSGAEVQCSVTIEYLNTASQATKRKTVRNAIITLGRNEFRDILVRVHDGKLSQSFILREIQLFTQFIRDGKSSIKLIPDNIQILVSNCPPDKLKVFFKTLSIKYAADKKASKPVSERARLRSTLPRTFDTISPVQVQDVKRANGLESHGTVRTPISTKGLKDRINNMGPSRHTKRPRSISSENRPDTELKSAKKPILSMPSGRKLTKEQSHILSTILKGKNIFFTGSAGTGKSFLLKRIVGALPPKSTYATASTGVAACHIGGTTLHAFAGIGSGKAPLQQCVELAQRSGIIRHWQNCRHLIIDEISMVEGEFFDKLEAVARIVRKCDEPFGGIQLIVCGDFLQLPPVSRNKEKYKFCFQAKSWQKCIQVNMELTEVRRQTDKKFIAILQSIRLGRCPEEVAVQLINTANQKIDRDGILATQLCTHKDDVELTNKHRLQQLPGELHTYQAIDSDPMFVQTLNAQCPAGQTLQLKKGAQVMLTRNLDIDKGMVNGARGVVIGFESGNIPLPQVRFLCGVTATIKPERWMVKGLGGSYLTRHQLPLKLAWAISIHKSQGMSLDCVEISLARVFESGQAYVALSRARSLEGLRVMDFDRRVVHANTDVLSFYSRLKKERILMQSSLDGYIETENQENKMPRRL